MMVKKYFALTLIAASLAVAGCSSSDDDDEGGATTAADGGVDTGGVDTAGGEDTGGVDTAGGVDTGGVDTAGGEDTGGTEGGTPVEDESTMTGTSILDLARGIDEDGDGVLEGGIPELSTLVAALGAYPDLLNLLDDEDELLTVFAPNNDAFAAAGELDEDAVKNILQYHVAPQNIDETAAAAIVAAGTPVDVANGGTVSITAAESGELQITDNDSNVIPLGTATSASSGNASVYVIGSVLAASDAPAEGDDSGSTDGEGTDTGATTGGDSTGAAGSTYAAIQDNADLSGFLGLVESSNFQLSMQDPGNNNQVIFAPTDGTFDPDLTDSVVSYVHTNRAGDASGPVGPGSYPGTGGQAIEFIVAGEGETLTVNGSPATYVETQSGGALYVYGD